MGSWRGVVTLGACGGSAPVSEDRQAVAVPVSDAPQRLNGCDRLTATEQPGASVRLPFGGMFGFAFDPACIALAVGTELTFVGNFAQHPLKPGRVEGDAVIVADNNPIQSTSTGSQASFVFSQPGSYGFFCEAHVHERMLGAVFVGPPPMSAPGEPPIAVATSVAPDGEGGSGDVDRDRAGCAAACLGRPFGGARQGYAAARRTAHAQCLSWHRVGDRAVCSGIAGRVDGGVGGHTLPTGRAAN